MPKMLAATLRLEAMVFFGVTISLMGHSVAFADEKPLTVTISSTAFFDSNRGLRTFNEQSVSGIRNRFGFATELGAERSNIKLGFSVADEYLDNESQKENDFTTLFANWLKKNERSQLDAKVSLTKDTTLADDVLASGPVEENVAVDRERINTSVSYTYLWSETKQISLFASAQSLDFERDLFALQSYDYYAIGLQPTWKYSADRSLFISITGSLVDFGDRELVTDNRTLLLTTSGESETINASLGWSYVPSERFSSTLSLGYRETTYNSSSGGVFTGSNPGEQKETGSGITVDLDFAYSTRRGQWSLLVQQASQPSSTGVLMDQRSALLATTIKTGERTNWNTRLRWLEQEADFDQVTRNDLESVSFSTTLVRRLSKTWNLSITYRYLQRELQQEDQAAETQLVQLGLRWQGDVLR